MDCTNCGSKIDNNKDHFCPNCGHAIHREKMSKRFLHSPWFKIIVVSVALALLLYGLLKYSSSDIYKPVQKQLDDTQTKIAGQDQEKAPLNSKGMMETLKKHLEAVKKNERESSYDFIAKELQKETPIEQFWEFIKSYPAFSDYTTYNITEPYIEDGIGRISVELYNDKGITVVEYALTEIEGQWKILGVHVEKTPDTEGKPFKMRDLMNVIQNFLSNLRSKDLEQAYQLTSVKFQEQNSFEAFSEFVKNHPEIVKSDNSSFEKLIFNNNIATLVGDINDGKNSLPIEFDLIKENDRWKILHIITHPAIEVNKTSEVDSEGKSLLEFTQMVISDEITDSGEIITPKTSFSNDVGDIYSNLYIKNGAKGEPFEVVLRHVESGTSIPPIKSSIEEASDQAIVSLLFSPPPTGWPKGNYQITAKSKGNHKTFTFKVE